MKSWAEGLVALGVTLVIGLGMWLYGGGQGAPSGEDGGASVAYDTAAAARGEALAASTGCLACHNIDGSASTGPGWQGLAGSTVTLDNGETVADDAYLFNSIVDPQAQIVAGFDPVMPTTYSDSLSQAEIQDLVEYIKSLA